jgi:hypothetical protein
VHGKHDLQSILSEFDALDEKKKSNEKEIKRKSQIKKRSNKKQHTDKLKVTDQIPCEDDVVDTQKFKDLGEEKVVNYDDTFLKKCECNIESLKIDDESPPLSPCVNNIKFSWDIKEKGIIEEEKNSEGNYNSLKDCLCRSRSPINIISYWNNLQVLCLEYLKLLF